MPKNRPLEIMKAISMFNPNTDFDDDEAKKKLSILLHELVMGGDSTSKEFFNVFFKSVHKVIKDMGVISKDAVVDDEVDMTPPQDDVATAEPKQNAPMGSKPQPKTEEIPDELMNASYNYIHDMANRFLFS